MIELANTKWKSTRVGTPPMEGDELLKYQNKLNNDWSVINDLKLEKGYKFPNFKKALEFVNQVGIFADDLNHHPDIHLSWGRCKITIWTHRINGLSPMDFVYAARIEMMYQKKFIT